MTINALASSLGFFAKAFAVAQTIAPENGQAAHVDHLVSIAIQMHASVFK